MALDIVKCVHVTETYIAPLDNITRLANSTFKFNDDLFPKTIGDSEKSVESMFNQWNAKRSKKLQSIENMITAQAQKRIKDDFERQDSIVSEKKMISRSKRLETS